jgi:orotate phosphoribosyltransferase
LLSVNDDLPKLSPTLERVRAHVLEHSVKRGEFVLKSGATSNWFLDAKQTACRPDGIIAISDAIVEVFGDDLATIDAIGGLTLGADPMAYGIAAVLGTRGHHLRSFSVRKEPKAGGITGRIAGALQPGDRVLVTEDTTTRGTSLIEAVEQIEAFGAEPVFMSVIVDRGGTCAAMAAEHGVGYRPLLTAPDLGFGFGS